MKRSKQADQTSRGRRWFSRWRNERGVEEPTHRPDLEPAHDQPWVPRSGLADRIRRSPRQ